MSNKKFFSGNSLRQALLSAAAHFDLSADDIAYREVEKKHGFLKTRKRVVIEVDAEDPRRPPATEAAAAETRHGGRRERGEAATAGAAVLDAGPSRGEGEERWGGAGERTPPARGREEGEESAAALAARAAGPETATPDADAEERAAPARGRGRRGRGPADREEEPQGQAVETPGRGGRGRAVDEEEPVAPAPARGRRGRGAEDEEEPVVPTLGGGRGRDAEDEEERPAVASGLGRRGRSAVDEEERPAVASGLGRRGRGAAPDEEERPAAPAASRNRRGAAADADAEAARPPRRRDVEPPEPDEEPADLTDAWEAGEEADEEPAGARPASEEAGEDSAEGRRRRRRRRGGRGRAAGGERAAGAEPGDDDLVALPERPRRPSERFAEARGPLADATRDALDRVLDVAGLDLGYTVLQGDDRLEIDLSGRDETLLVAEGGELLRAIEHLVPRMVRTLSGEPVNVRVDAADFHEIHEEQLRTLAQRVASEVRRSERPRTLEPMSPADRRIVHITLADEPRVTSMSEGTGYFKRIVVKPA